MQIGFVHFDREDQKKYLAAISRITEGGAIDELGVGRLRDYYSDRLFPGVSSLHQHAKYFSLMPQLYREAVLNNKFRSLSEVRPIIRKLEIELTEKLCEGSPGVKGITGSDALRESGKYVKYDPMYIYGMALQTYGIVKTDSLEQAIFYASKKYHERPVKLSAKDDEQGDSEDQDSVLGFLSFPSNLEYNWREGCSLNLTPSEQDFLTRHILEISKATKNSLLHYLLDNKIWLNKNEVPTYEVFVDWIRRKREDLPDHLLSDILRASHFSDLVDGLFYRYNWLYSGKTDTKVLDKFNKWYEEVFIPGKEAMAASLEGVVINDNDSIPFCTNAIKLLSHRDWDELDYRIQRREQDIKHSRHKIDNVEAGYHYDPDHPIHDYKLQFRWATVRLFVNEILGGSPDE